MVVCSDIARLVWGLGFKSAFVSANRQLWE